MKRSNTKWLVLCQATCLALAVGATLSMAAEPSPNMRDAQVQAGAGMQSSASTRTTKADCQVAVLGCAVSLFASGLACGAIFFSVGGATPACFLAIAAAGVECGAQVGVSCSTYPEITTSEIQLPKVGNINTGVDRVVECDGDERVHSIGGFHKTGDGLTRISMSCTNGDTMHVGENNSDVATEATCDTGELMKGVAIRHDHEYIYAISPICGTFDKVIYGDDDRDGWVGNTGLGVISERLCPHNKWVNGFAVTRDDGPIADQDIRGLIVGCAGL